VTGEIVQHDDLAWSQGRNEALLDIGPKAVSIHRAVQYTRSRHPIDAQSGDEGRCLPMAPGNAGHETLPARAAPIATCHVGGRPRFVEEDQVFRVQLGLLGAPFLAPLRNIGPILLGRAL